MFAYVGESLDELKSLFIALQSSAREDNIAKKYGLNPVHGDGWGYVIYDGEHLYYYKSVKPIFEEDFPLGLDLKGEFYAIFHARQATDKSTVSARFSHPFMESNDTYIYFFAHNGSVNDGKLRKELNFNGITTDSELAAKYYAKTENMKYLESITLSALNVLILRIRRSDGVAELLYENYYVKDRPDYYDLYLWKGKKGRAVMSSTLKLYGFLDVEQVPKGQLLKL